MSDIAHCPRCGSKPNALSIDEANSVCFDCGFNIVDARGIEAGGPWNRAVLSDLAAQERELFMRSGEPDGSYMERRLARSIMLGEYAWLGTYPLSLPK